MNIKCFVANVLHYIGIGLAILAVLSLVSVFAVYFWIAIPLVVAADWDIILWCVLGASIVAFLPDIVFYIGSWVEQTRSNCQ